MKLETMYFSETISAEWQMLSRFALYIYSRWTHFQETLDVIHEGQYDYIHQASLQNDEIRGSADLLERIYKPSIISLV